MTRALALPVVKVAVVGHTNTGKTSLLRTLTEDVTFGDVSDRPGTTRHVEETVLLVDGRPLVELYDTPGMEDSIGLLELLEARRTDRRADWVDVIRAALAGPEARGRFEQEAKVLRQLLASDVALYVVDVRDRMLGKHRDELEILARCARPVVPVLNFVASPDARTDEWRQQLMRLNLHAVAEFDTVVVDETAETRLYEKMRTLLDPFSATLDALITDRQYRRRERIEEAAERIADLLVDVAAYVRLMPEQDDPMTAVSPLQQVVRDREQRCVDDLLVLFRFRSDDFEADTLPITDGRWGMDLFSSESLKRFGLTAGGGAAAGGLAGLAIDVMTGGLSLGMAAAIGATVGALWSSVRTHGQRLADVFRGYTELRVREETLQLLALRQLELVRALLARGHASQNPLKQTVKPARGLTVGGSKSVELLAEGLPTELETCRSHPEWSRLAAGSSVDFENDGERNAVRDALTQRLMAELGSSQLFK